MVTIYFIRGKSRFNKSWASFIGLQVGQKKFLKKLHTLELCNENGFFFQSLRLHGGFSPRSNFDLPPSSVHMDGISHLMKKNLAQLHTTSVIGGRSLLQWGQVSWVLYFGQVVEAFESLTSWLHLPLTAKSHPKTS